MQIKVTFDNGTTGLYPVTPNSVLTVKEPAPNDVTPGAELSFAFVGATAVELIADADPVEVPAAVDEAPGEEPDAAATPEDSPPAETETAPDPTTTSDSASLTPEPNDSPTNSDDSTPVVGTSSDAAAIAANDAILQAALGTSTPDALSQALTDVTAALEQYPDSPELADAKTQLTELAAAAVTPTA